MASALTSHTNNTIAGQAEHPNNQEVFDRLCADLHAIVHLKKRGYEGVDDIQSPTPSITNNIESLVASISSLIAHGKSEGFKLQPANPQQLWDDMQYTKDNGNFHAAGVQDALLDAGFTSPER